MHSRRHIIWIFVGLQRRTFLTNRLAHHTSWSCQQAYFFSTLKQSRLFQRSTSIFLCDRRGTRLLHRTSRKDESLSFRRLVVACTVRTRSESETGCLVCTIDAFSVAYNAGTNKTIKAVLGPSSLFSPLRGLLSDASQCLS
jgi:hypothetical protein